MVAPDHAKDTILDVDESDIARILLERPDDVRYAVDAAIAAASEPGVLNGLIQDGYAPENTTSSGNLTYMFARMTISNIPNGSSLMWIHFCFLFWR